MTNTNRTVQQAVRFALAAFAASAYGPLVIAQTAPQAAAEASAGLEEVVVTGSRIHQAPNDISISPMTSVTSVDIEQSGLIRTEDLLNNLPQVTAEFGANLSNSSNGTATVSLRDLGSQRTEVLVNGRRMQAGAGLGNTSSSANIDQIPADLIDRVDVLTGGASAVYGADAVAGVVNFILNTHYEGVKVSSSYGFYNHQNNNSADLADLSAFGAPLPPSTVNTGQQKDVSIVAGSDFADGRGNGTAYFTYTNSAPAVGYQFDHSGCTLVTPPNAAALLTQGPSCGGSGTSGHGQFLMEGLTAGGHTGTIVDNAVDPKSGAFRPYNASLDDYNYGALSYFLRPMERYTGGSFLNYEINEHADVYSEFMFTRNTSTAQYGPSGDFFQLSNISCTDPLLTSQELATLCNPATLAANRAVYGNAPNTFTLYVGRRNVEGGGRIDSYSATSFREVLGTKGKIDDVWSYDFYGQVGVSDLNDHQVNFLGTEQMTNALNVIPNPAVGGVAGVAAGAPVCAAAVSGSAPNCVPWNIWTPGGVTAAALAYMSVPSTYATTATEYITNASVVGDLGKYGIMSPLASRGMGVDAGAEYREEIYDFSPDYIFANGLAGGANGIAPAIHGEFHVAEAFTEMKLPLIEEKAGAYDLAFEGGYRFSSYTEGFNTNTFKLGLEWAPIRDTRFRASFNRAVRAPNIYELSQPASVVTGGTGDPCWGSTPQLTLAECERTGVTPSEYGHIAVNSAAQINTLLGGNADLKPEEADTFTIGLVVQPQAIPNLVMSVDYFDIKINNTITELTSNNVIFGCALGYQALCNSIHRGPGGSLWLSLVNDYVTTLQENVGTLTTKGVDLKGHYRLEANTVGHFTFDLNGTYTGSFVTDPVPGVSALNFNCAGYWGATCGAPLPKWRHVFTTTWGAPWAGLEVTAKWRYIGSSNVDSENPSLLLNGPYFPGTAHIPGYNYLDLSASMPLTSAISLRLGVNNVTDKDPPLVLNGNYTNCPNTTCNNNTWAGTYDALGRYIYARVSAKF
jgi:iron complex outermembrane recepter protein